MRSEAPTLAATAAAARTRFSALCDPPYAAVTRVTRRSGRQRKPRGASASGTGELCSSRSVTLPSAMWPNDAGRRRAEHDQRSPHAARPARADPRAPTGRCAARRSRSGLRAGWPGLARGPRRRSRRGTGGTPRRWPSPGSTGPGRPSRPRGRRPRSGRACRRGGGRPGRARPARSPRSSSSVAALLVVDQADVLVPAQVRVPEAVDGVPHEGDGHPDQEHPDRDGAQVLDDPDAAGDRQERQAPGRTAP